MKKTLIAHVKGGESLDEGVADGLQLGGYDGDHRDLDTVELVKAAPRSTLTETWGRQNASVKPDTCTTLRGNAVTRVSHHHRHKREHSDPGPMFEHIL